jgi:hypothetical protein
VLPVANRKAILLNSRAQFQNCTRFSLDPFQLNSAAARPALTQPELELLESKMKHRMLVTAGLVLLPITAWTVSKDFNGEMWLAQVPALPSSGQTAYSQWVDDGQGNLALGEGFKNVETGMNQAIADQAQGNAPSHAQTQQQMSSAQQMMQKYSTPEGQAELKSMTPAQLMALSQQMMPQTAPPGIVSPEDQARLQKISNGVYSGQQQVLEGSTSVNKEAQALCTQWDADAAPLVAQEAAAEQMLPVCPGEAGIPSDMEVSKVKLEYANKRVVLAGQYLSKFAPLVDKMKVVVRPEIDFGDDAIAAWSQIQDPALKQQVSASAHGAEQQGFGGVSMVETLIKNASEKAAQTVADEKAIQKRYANAKGCS